MELEVIQSKLHTLEVQQSEKQKKSNMFSIVRLLLILAVIYCAYQGFDNGNTLYYGVMILVLIIFLYLVKLHQRLKNEIEDIEAMIVVLEDITKRKGTGWKSFVDTGKEFLEKGNTQAYDLDLFGNASLYQYLVTAKTIYGREMFARLLSCEIQEPSAITRRQAAVKECVHNVDFTLHMNRLSILYAKHAKKKKKKLLEEFFTYVEEPHKAYPEVVSYFLMFFPMLTIFCMLAFSLFQANLGFALICLTFSMCTALLFVIKNSKELAYVEGITDMMKDYQRMIESFSHSDLQSPYFKDLQKQMEDAQQGIKELCKILGIVKMRSNLILNLLFNAVFLLDFQCVFIVQKWTNKYGKNVRAWLQAMGEVEAIVSLAQLSFAKEECVFPSLHTGGAPFMEMEAMKHPLIVESEAIANSFQAEHGSFIITGSNMSGKTTFLRTIGVNMVLFHAGAMVCAKHFEAESMNFYTSMRVQDDVSEGISTFYAEILRIKQMMEESKKEKPMFVLIDEIFKGTNSADRILCAKQAIVRLHLPWVLTMVSTHDFELCDLDKDKQVQATNYHFSEYYEGDKLCFDYTLKNGRCTTTNAKQLMKLAGF